MILSQIFGWLLPSFHSVLLSNATPKRTSWQLSSPCSPHCMHFWPLNPAFSSLHLSLLENMFNYSFHFCVVLLFVPPRSTRISSSIRTEAFACLNFWMSTIWRSAHYLVWETLSSQFFHGGLFLASTIAIFWTTYWHSSFQGRGINPNGCAKNHPIRCGENILEIWFISVYFYVCVL